MAEFSNPWSLEVSENYPHMAKLKKPYAGTQLFDLADARLMVAAPEMVHVLRTCQMLFQFGRLPAHLKEKALCDIQTVMQRAGLPPVAL